MRYCNMYQLDIWQKLEIHYHHQYDTRRNIIGKKTGETQIGKKDNKTDSLPVSIKGMVFPDNAPLTFRQIRTPLSPCIILQP